MPLNPVGIVIAFRFFNIINLYAANDDYAYEYNYPDNIKADNVYFTIDSDTKARIRELENYLMRIPLFIAPVNLLATHHLSFTLI